MEKARCREATLTQAVNHEMMETFSSGRSDQTVINSQGLFHSWFYKSLDPCILSHHGYPERSPGRSSMSENKCLPMWEPRFRGCGARRTPR